ncbi:hypothetical protein D9M68_951720 [compost metagenome]
MLRGIVGFVLEFETETGAQQNSGNNEFVVCSLKVLFIKQPLDVALLKFSVVFKKIKIICGSHKAYYSSIHQI